MGADRLKAIKDNAKRGWNIAQQRLLNPSQLSLFDIDPTFARRSFKIMLKEKVPNICDGDELLLHTNDEKHFVTRGPETLGQCHQIPAGILDELKVGGTLCVEVVAVGTITNTLEVAPK